MNRVGFFTGKIYKDGELPEVGECCFCVTDEELKDDEAIKQKGLAIIGRGVCSAILKRLARLNGKQGGKNNESFI